MTAADDKREMILESALMLFGTKGFYESKISDIAEHAGIAKGTIYLYFSSKEDLFKAMTERDFSVFLEGLAAVSKSSAAFDERLFMLAGKHLGYFYKRRNFKRIFFQAPNNDPELWQMFIDFMKTYMETVVKIMADANLPQPDLHARAFCGMLDAFKMDILIAEQYSQADVQASCQFVVQLFLDGVETGKL